VAALLEKVRAGEVSHVVVYKLDRLTRRTRDLLALVEDELKPRGVALVSLSEAIDTASPAGVMVLTMLGALAQMERELIAERTKAALAHKKTRGDRLGTTPLGFRTPEAGAAMVPVADELAPVAHVLTRRAAGLPFRAIAAELAAAGYATKRGGQWDGTTVRKLWLGRARYAAVAELTPYTGGL
jgi:DNA invertase Pin-like site-specific DNA recombinase